MPSHNEHWNSCGCNALSVCRLDFPGLETLFQHFIVHYEKLGALRKEMLLTVHSKDHPETLMSESLRIADTYSIPRRHVQTWRGQFSNGGSSVLKFRLIRELQLPLDAWIIDADLDEFHVYARPPRLPASELRLRQRQSDERLPLVPWWCRRKLAHNPYTHANGSDSHAHCTWSNLMSVREKVAELEAGGFNGAISKLVDRVSSSGQLISLSPPSEQSIFKQLPLECDVVGNVIRGSNQKVVLWKNTLRPHMGHHCLHSPRIALRSLARDGFLKHSRQGTRGRLSGGWAWMSERSFDHKLQELNGCWGAVMHMKFIKSVSQSASRRLEERQGKDPAWRDSLRTVQSIVKTSRVPLRQSDCQVSSTLAYPRAQRSKQT